MAENKTITPHDLPKAAFAQERLYLSLLEDNLHHCIAKWSRKVPNETWAINLDQEIWSLFMNKIEPFAGVMRILMKNIIVCGEQKRNEKEDGYSILSKELPTEIKVVMLTKFGKFVENLKIQNEKGDVKQEIIHKVSTCGASLKKLMLEIGDREGAIDSGLEILKAFATQLESLTISCSSPRSKRSNILSTVAQLCRKLKHLELHFENDSIYPALFPNVGANLQSLIISVAGLNENIISEIKQHYREIRKIELHCSSPSKSTADATVRLCVSLKDQLESAVVSFLAPCDWSKIVAGCPDALLSSGECWQCKMKNAYEMIQAIGKSLSKYEMCFHATSTYDSNDLNKAIKVCSKLRSVSVLWYSADGTNCTKALLSASMRNLRHLHLDFIKEARHYTDEDFRNAWRTVLNLIATNTGRLEKLRLIGLNTAENELKDIADNNLLVHYAHFSVLPSSSLASMAIGLLNAFTRNDNLTRVDIDCATVLEYSDSDLESGSSRCFDERVDFSSIRTACLPYRRRGISVHVFGELI